MESGSGVSLHKPGTPSLGAVLDVGLKCPHSCQFCYYSFFDGGTEQFKALRKASYRSIDDCCEIVRLLSANGLNHIDITGGEPSAHPGIVEIIAEASRIEVPSRLITLGQFLHKSSAEKGKLLDRLLDSGLTDFLLSLHASEQELFKHLCGGSLRLSLAVMDDLDSRGIHYGCNTVVTSKNIAALPDIARLAVSHGTYVHNFICFNAYHAWRGKTQAEGLQVRYNDVRPLLEEAVDILTSQKRVVNIRYAPLCAFPSLARHVVGALGTIYDPYEWRNRCLCHDKEPAWCAESLPVPAVGVPDRYAYTDIEEIFAGINLTGMRGDRFKYFVSACKECPAKQACDGIDPTYLERFGESEFSPLALAVNSNLLKVRLDYIPGFLVKTEQKADMLRLLKKYI